MNVSYSDNVTNTIGYLRSNVYNKEVFKNLFSSNLKRAINASNVYFVPDQFGGWTVNVDIYKFDPPTNPEDFSDDEDNISMIDAITYIRKVCDALVDSIMIVDRSVSCSDIAANLVNVIITGPDSIIVKL